MTGAPMTNDTEPQTATPDPPPADESRFDRRMLLPVAVLVGVLAVATVVLALSGGTKTALPGGAKSAKAPDYAGQVLSPSSAAPPIVLRNSLGQRISLSQYRGKVVFVTFLYTHCPDVCPLIASQLRVAQSELGARAAGMQVVAVSADPRGDTPASVADFLRAHEMTGRMQYLIGSAGELGRVWHAWNVGSQRDASNPGFVAHSALVYGISAQGNVTTIYPANFKPGDIVHDVPRLAVH